MLPAMLRISKYTWLTFYLYCHETKNKQKKGGGGGNIQQNVATRHKFGAPENFKVSNPRCECQLKKIQSILTVSEDNFEATSSSLAITSFIPTKCINYVKYIHIYHQLSPTCFAV